MPETLQSMKDKTNEGVLMHAHSSKQGVTKNAEQELQIVDKNVQSLASSIIWLENLIKARIEELESGKKIAIEEYALSIDKTYFTKETSFFKLLDEYGNTYVEYLLVSLAFCAWFRPQTLAFLAKKQEESNEIHTETGIIASKINGKVIPTLQTALFLLAGKNITKQAYYYTVLTEHALFKDQILCMRKPHSFNNFPNEYMLELDLAYYNFLLNGRKPRFDGSQDFPAALLETEKTFDDLVLKESTKEQLQVIMDYAANYKQLFSREGAIQKIKQGLLAMLYGPPGTGKTFTVSVMSKKLGVDAYRIDLSRVISKYIGETEKNLEKIFTRLADKNCILFFDEADVLFGKRTEVKDAKDRYANQEVAYLLQRIETFPGLVILASNFNQNLDPAFKRRILVSIYMAPPDFEERQILWNNSLPAHYQFVPDNLPLTLAEQHPFTGANIANVIKLACIKAETENTNEITNKMLEPYIKLEYSKEGTQQRKLTRSDINA